MVVAAAGYPYKIIILYPHLVQGNHCLKWATNSGIPAETKQQVNFFFVRSLGLVAMPFKAICISRAYTLFFKIIVPISDIFELDTRPDVPKYRQCNDIWICKPLNLNHISADEVAGYFCLFNLKYMQGLTKTAITFLFYLPPNL